jgi:signal peptidase I
MIYFINGDPYQEHYTIYTDSNVFPKNEQPRDNFGPVKIPEDSLFVMGDNRDQSYDSRFWGFVKKSSVKGRGKRYLLVMG